MIDNSDQDVYSSFFFFNIIVFSLIMIRTIFQFQLTIPRF